MARFNRAGIVAFAERALEVSSAAAPVGVPQWLDRRRGRLQPRIRSRHIEGIKGSMDIYDRAPTPRQNRCRLFRRKGNDFIGHVM